MSILRWRFLLIDGEARWKLRRADFVSSLEIFAGVGVERGDEGVFDGRPIIDTYLINDLESSPVVGKSD